MKIWIVTTEYPPAFGGGIGTYVENVANMYSKNGDKVKVILRDNVDERKFKNENLEVCRFKLKYEKMYKYMGEVQSMAYQYFEYINALLAEEKPDIIEIQEYNSIGYYILQRKYIDNEYLKYVPVVVHLHTPQFALYSINKSINYKLPDYWVGEMEKFCIKAADALLCPSEFLANKLKSINKNVPIKVINLPFNLKEENNESIQKDNKLFVYFGRTEYRKGVEQLVKAFEELWKKGYDCKLKCIGGDVKFFPKDEYLGEILAKKYSDRIEQGLLEFKPNTPQLELIEDVKQARAVVIPSLYENFPNTCIMSMWLKKPVIVSKQGGQAEMVEKDGINGYIFDHDINGDLEQKIIKVLNDSEECLKKMGDRAHERIYELCNFEKNLKLRKEFFNSVIDNYTQMDVYPFLNDENNFYKSEVSGKRGTISVVIPYYNMGKYIDECVNSIKESVYENIEIIIVNDGSNDESVEALKKYRNDKTVKVIDIENAGLANARNVGASVASGEFIAFLDADDMVEKSFYSKAVNILNRFKNVSYVFSWVKYFEGSNGRWTTFDTQLPYLLCHNMLNANALIRRTDFIKYGRNRVEMEFGMEDYDMWISLAENNCFGVCIPEYLSLYRVRKDSMAREFNANNLLYSHELITKNHKALYSKYGTDLFNILQANGQSFVYNNPSFVVDAFEIKNTIRKRRFVDILWRYKIYRNFIKFLQDKGILKKLKKIKNRDKSDN